MSRCRRRDFLRATAVVTCCAVESRAAAADDAHFHLLSKPLQWLDYDLLAEAVAAAGFQGVELTVRPQGHVEPDRVRTDLPRAIAAARRQGLACDMIVTEVTAADDRQAEEVLETAAAEGVKTYRLGYVHYDPQQPVQESLDHLRAGMELLADLNRRIGITGCYQNHHGSAGQRLGGGVWDIHAILAGSDPRWLGCQYDVRHAVAESTGSWDVPLRLIAPWIRSVCLKDFRWNEQHPLRPADCRAGQGLVPWNRAFGLLGELGIDGPMSVHCEWPLFTPAEAALDIADRRALATERIREDRVFFAQALRLSHTSGR